MDNNDTVLDLEVDVNGEEVFVVNKRILSLRCRRFEALLRNSKPKNRAKVVFNDFPGGASIFELVAKFCYNGGKIDVNPHNVCQLTLAAHFLEMTKEPSDLCEQTEKSFKEVSFWAWSELMEALKHCQELQKNTNSIAMLDNLLENIVERIVLCYESTSSPSISSSESSAFRPSSESSRSIESPKSTNWWFKDLSALNAGSLTTLANLMSLRSFDGATLSRFLFYYQKSKFTSASTRGERVEVFENVVEALRSLDVESVSHKGLFRMLGVSRNMGSGHSCAEKLERIIGLQLDKSTLDDLLVPCQVAGAGYMYDVDLILRLVRCFVGEGDRHLAVARLKKVSSLMDTYLAEVAPDPRLKPSKFLALIGALSGNAREFDDGVYFAVSIYLKVHSGLCEEQRTKLCFGISYEKLSPQAFGHLMHNKNFPSEAYARALTSRQKKLKSLLRPTMVGSIQFQKADCDRKARKGRLSEQIVIYAKKFSITDENEKLKARLQGMQWRVLELEKVCRKMQVQMADMMRSRMYGQSRAKNVPRLCS